MISQADKRLTALEDQLARDRRRINLDVLTYAELEQLEALLSKHDGKFDPNAATDAEREWLVGIIERVKHEA